MGDVPTEREPSTAILRRLRMSPGMADREGACSGVKVVCANERRVGCANGAAGRGRAQARDAEERREAARRLAVDR
jgi:hypothetical protein